MMRSSLYRLGGVIAGATALGVVAAGPAAAHHCYKAEWQAAAHSQLAENNTPWMPMTGFVAFALTEFVGMPAECAAHSGEFVAAWMEANGVDQEPLIHMRATAGGGAADRETNPREPQAFNYLDDDDFGFIVGQAMQEEDCAAPAPPA